MTPTAEHHALSMINLAIDALPEVEQDAIRAGVELALALPRAIVAMRHVLAHGGAKRGIGAGERDGQTAREHVAGMLRHVDRIDDPFEVDVDPLTHRDPDSGELTLAHVAARAALAIEAGGR